jgi:hypothetical protein
MMSVARVPSSVVRFGRFRLELFATVVALKDYHPDEELEARQTVCVWYLRGTRISTMVRRNAEALLEVLEMEHRDWSILSSYVLVVKVIFSAPISPTAPTAGGATTGIEILVNDWDSQHYLEVQKRADCCPVHSSPKEHVQRPSLLPAFAPSPSICLPHSVGANCLQRRVPLVFQRPPLVLHNSVQCCLYCDRDLYPTDRNPRPAQVLDKKQFSSLRGGL